MNDWLKIIRRYLSLLLGGALMSLAPHGLRAAERPNIVFCFADDWGRHASIYKEIDGPGSWNDVVKTPTFDRLAREGVVFRRAHVNAPSCTPCRSALLSGQYFFRTGRGAILRGATWDSSIPSYPLLLLDSGYHIGKSFKVWSPGTPADAPYGGQKYSYQKAGGAINQFSTLGMRMLAEGKTADDVRKLVFDQVRDNFTQFIADRKPGQPFCYWFGPTNTHRKWAAGSGKKLWGIEPDSLKGKMPAYLPDVPEIREDVADYLGEAQAFDAAVGVIVEQLRKTGELENTIVVVSGDHGAGGFPYCKCSLYDSGTGVALAIRGPGVKPGRVVDDFVNLMDLAPTFLELGGLKPPEVMTGRSIVPLLTSEKAGQIDPQRNFVVTGRERHVDVARPNNAPYPQRAIRTKEHLLIINFKPDRWPMGNPYHLDTADKEPTVQELTEDTRATFQDMDGSPTKAWLVSNRNRPDVKPFYNLAFAPRPRIELYDTAKDPDQVKNVADNPAYAKVRDQLEAQLMSVLDQANDPRLKDDGAYFEKTINSGPQPITPKNPAKK